jgi:hypothetical protein
MGRTARNESIKLRAAFFNNIAVGAVVTGMIVPCVAVWRLMLQGPVNQTELYGLGLLLFLVYAVTLVGRSEADRALSKLED